MARPREIKLESGGTIKLQDVPKELADKIEALATGKSLGVEQEVLAVPRQEPPKNNEVISSDGFLNTALGLIKRDNKYDVVVVKFDPESKQAIVTEFIYAGDFRDRAFNKFKQEVVQRKLNLV